MLALAAVSVLGVAFAALAEPRPRLVWNASPSAPVGLYWLAGGRAFERGDLVLAELPEPAASLAAERGYLPQSVPLIKRIVALDGDVVCAETGLISVNGRIVAARLAEDSAGRPMPTWSGCRMLRDGQVFLVMQGVHASFDGRYFGPVEAIAIVARLVPLWTW